MTVKFRSRAVRKQRGREVFFYSAVLNSYIMTKHNRDRCWLPSCQKELDSKTCRRHHWDFMGKIENPWCYPEVIHLFCPSFCHDRVHRIAALIVAHLEIYYGVLDYSDLVQSVAFILNEPDENVEFVLRDEFVPAKIVEVKRGKCKLIWRVASRISNIKKYLLLRDPRMAINLGICVDYN